MTMGSTGFWGVRFAAAALLALLVTVTGCERPPDEAWLRVVQFTDGEGGTAVSKVTSIVKITSTKELGTTDYVNAVFANQSTVVGSDKAVAGGVTVDRVLITYAIAGYSAPSATYPVTLYVPAATSAATTTTTLTAAGTPGTATLEIALVSTALKSWLAATVPANVLAGGLDGSARLVFHARSFEGGDLETEAGIGIVFQNVTKTETETETKTSP